MAAITKSFTTIADAAIDPDSPLTTSLMTALRDNAIHVREWLGASYTAGAVQDHDHDGLNSALVEVGPNWLRNGSFEGNEAGWTFTNYSGGSHAQSSSSTHGAKSMTFTSTSTGNGGGEAVSNEYVGCGAGQPVALEWWMWASVANVSMKIEVIWYDAAKSQISVSSAYSTTNTSTTGVRGQAYVTAPAGTKWMRVRITAPVPGSGSSTGTVYIDGMHLTRAIEQSHIVTAAVGQAQLKTTNGLVSTFSNIAAALVLPGGEYGFYPQLAATNGSAAASSDGLGSTNSLTQQTLVYLKTANGGYAAYCYQRYVQASPPYDLGDGEVPLFVFLALDGTGRAVHAWAAEDPPWANNGPTNCRAEFYRAGVGYQRVRDLSAWSPGEIEAMPWDEYAAALREAPVVERAITQARKQADMPLIPHPFAGDLTGLTVVLLDPVSALCGKLAELHRDGERLHDLIAAGEILLDNTPLKRAAPPGVMPVRARFAPVVKR